MPVSLTWESQDAIPPELVQHAVEKDGKWAFEAETASEVGNLKGTLKKERDSRTKYEAEVKRFERFKPLADADEEEVSQFFDAWSKRGEQSDKGKPGEDSIKLKEQLEKAHQKALKAREDELGLTKTELQKAHTELRDYKLWTPLRDVFIAQGGEAGDWELARLELSAQGRFGFDDEGRIAVMEDGSPSTVTPQKFFKEVYSEMRPKFYKASAAGGSGAQNNTNGAGRAGKRISVAEFDKLAPADQAAKIKDGFQVYD